MQNLTKYLKLFLSKYLPVFLPLILITILSLVIRLSVIEYRSGDYYSFLYWWFKHIAQTPVDSIYKTSFANYTMPYLYLLGIGSGFLNIIENLTGFKNLYQDYDIWIIKGIGFIFDFLMAFIMIKIALLSTQRKFFKDTIGQLLSFFIAGIILLHPIVLLNGAVWAQSDVIYSFFCILSFYFILKEKGFLAITSFAVAISFKAQAIFLAPILAIWLIYNLQKWWYFFQIPVTYILLSFPAALQGRSWLSLLSIYADQAGTYQYLSARLPNFWFFLENKVFKESIHVNQYNQVNMGNNFDMLVGFGQILTVTVIILLLMLWFYLKPKMTSLLWIRAAAFFALLAPFILPKMHERYYFFTEMVLIIYAIFFPRRFYIPIIVTVASFFGYLPFLFGLQFLDIIYYSIFAVFAVLLYLTQDLIRSVIQSSQLLNINN
jgi:Gpi18-like mannosyltransferase